MTAARSLAVRTPSGAVSRGAPDADGPAPARLGVIAPALQALTGCQDVYLLEASGATGALRVWRGRDGTRDRGAEALLPPVGGHPLCAPGISQTGDAVRRLSDVATVDQRTETAVRLVRRLLGRHQLAVRLPAVEGRPARSWLLTRSGWDFTDEDLATTTVVLPLLAAADDSERPGPSDPVDALDPRVDAATASWARLSPRERQVVDLLVAGHTARRMGIALGISPRTVAKHLQNAYDKLGCHDRMAIAVEHSRLETVAPAHSRAW